MTPRDPAPRATTPDPGAPKLADAPHLAPVSGIGGDDSSHDVQEGLKAATRATPLQMLLASGPGRAGVLLVGLMTLLSLWVMATYPRDFGGSRWSNPNVWADNPKNAPPIWTSLFGPAVPHRNVTVVEPVETRTISAGQINIYRVPVVVTSSGPPASLAVTLTGVTFQQRPPAVLTTLVRPDGGTIRLTAIPVPAPRSGETGPYRRFYESSERALLATGATPLQSVETFFADRYPENGTAISQDQLMRALFSRPDGQGSNGLTPLPGDYALEIQTITADPEDRFAPIQVTLGGTAYGLMGTDGLGRDLWSGLLYGFPVALLIATLTAVASTIVGASLGIASGYSGGVVDAVIQRCSDIVANVPTLPLLIFLVSLIGRHLWLIMLVLVAFSWPGLTILIRSMVLQLREGQLVESAQALGASRRRIMARHVFPQVAPFIIAQMIFFAPGAILAEASLSFLGLGDPSIPTWGQMLEAGFRTGALYVGYWWWVLPPGILIVLTAVAFMLIALGLEPIVDPRLRRPS